MRVNIEWRRKDNRKDETVKGMGGGGKPGLRMLVKIKNLWKRGVNKGPGREELIRVLKEWY